MIQSLPWGRWRAAPVGVLHKGANKVLTEKDCRMTGSPYYYMVCDYFTVTVP